MQLKDFIKERIVFILINIGILAFTAALLSILKVDGYAIIFILVLNFIGILIFHINEYLKKRKYYNEFLCNIEKLDKKYLISEVMEEGDFLEGKILYDIIRQTDKSMNDEVASLKINNNEYREYIELWVHEVKTPIATCKLLIENNPSEITKSINEEVEKVENYIEQALFYTRSNTLEKDYIIKEINIKNCINSVIRKNANILIEKGIKIKIEDIDRIVYTDIKWIEFILHQIISNSIKYMDKEISILNISCEEYKESIILHISDNGIGMNEKDVIKAFEKGYTGENGRKFGKATGIGLYLCRKLSLKLGLSIKLKSEINKGTRVSILFPLNKMMIFE